MTSAALESLKVEGIATNRSFLLAYPKHPSFVAGDVHTKFVESLGGELLETARAFDSVPA